MEARFIKSKNVCKDNGKFILHVGYNHYDFGIQVHEWGVRVMLIWWHWCFHF